MIRNIKDLKQLNNGRYDYSHVSGDLPLPNLVEIQTKSYEEFKEKGLDEVFSTFAVQFASQPESEIKLNV